MSKGAEQILNGNRSSGQTPPPPLARLAEVASYNAEAMKTDVLTYSRSRDFAGVR
jgi:hypothetical protein